MAQPNKQIFLKTVTLIAVEDSIGEEANVNRVASETFFTVVQEDTTVAWTRAVAMQMEKSGQTQYIF